MKLRICGNSVRIRVTRTETARLGAGEAVEQMTEFPGKHRLISTVEPSPHASSVTAAFADGKISIVVPLAQARTWAGSDAVSIEAAQPIDSGQSLQILIEKDFQCLHSKAEENADAFPNPRG
jgi:hypothetical protein